MPAAEAALAVLHLLASRPGPVPAAEVVRDLGLPWSSAYRVLAALPAALVGATAAELTTRLGGQPVLSATRRGPAPR